LFVIDDIDQTCASTVQASGGIAETLLQRVNRCAVLVHTETEEERANKGNEMVQFIKIKADVFISLSEVARLPGNLRVNVLRCST
jgi:hypothetical protein